jgi:hypothetical protein
MEEFHNDPALMSRLIGNAHRERSRAVGTALRGALTWFSTHLKSLASRPNSRPSRWIARLG